METSSVGLTVAVRPIFVSAETLASASKSRNLFDAMKARLGRSCVSPISLIASSLAASCGLYYEMERSSMNDPFGYMATPAGLAEQFQRVAVMIEHNTDSRDTADNAFLAFCQRMCNGPTLAALSKVVEYPEGGELTMIRFLEHLRPFVQNQTDLTKHATIVFNNITRHLKAMEIPSDFLAMCNRAFIWTTRGIQMAAKNQLLNKSQVLGDVEQWTGKVARKERAEPKSAIDDGVLSIFKYKMKDTQLETFEWSIKLSEDGLVVRRGHAESLEGAADQVYRAFYSAMTKKKAVDASAVQPGTQLVILGNWITNEQYMAYPRKENLQIVSDASDDTRDDMLFVIGYPALGKQKAVVTAHRVRKARNYGEQNSDNVVIELRSGFTLDATQDWYVLKVERFIKGEVMCGKCQKVGDLYNLGCVNVRGRGLLCGPCIDYLMENDQLESDAHDIQMIV